MGFDGFDSVELVMALEDRLGLSIPDRDADRLRTPGQTVDYLAARLGLAADGPTVRCRSAEAFYRSRPRLAAMTGAPVNAIRPSVATANVLPPADDAAGRRAAWSRLSHTLGVRLPALRHPRWCWSSAIVIGLAVAICVFCLATLRTPESAWGVATLITVVTAAPLAVPAALLAATRSRLATDVPAGYETLGDLTSCLTPLNLPETPASPAGWTRHELWEMVRDLTAQSAGCAPSRIVRDSPWPA